VFVLGRAAEPVRAPVREPFKWPDFMAPVEIVPAGIVDELRAEVDETWKATGCAGAVRGMVPLAEVVAAQRQDRNELRAEVASLREALQEINPWLWMQAQRRDCLPMDTCVARLVEDALALVTPAKEQK